MYRAVYFLNPLQEAQTASHMAILTMGDSKQHSREHIMHEFLQEPPPEDTVRILGDVPNSILDPKDYLSSIHLFASKVKQCLHEYHTDNKTSFLAANIYPGKHSFFVIDLNNTSYNYDTAHECMTPVPVYDLRFSKRAPSIRRAGALDGQIAGLLAKMHNGHGWVPLPLLEDHNDPDLQYCNPRSLQG